MVGREACAGHLCTRKCCDRWPGRPGGHDGGHDGAKTGAKTGAMTGKIGRRLLAAPYFSTKGVTLGTSKVNGQT